MKILILYSGGKDSQASLIWAVKKYGVKNCEAVFCDTGWENPVTYEHIRETTASLGVKLAVIKSKKYDGMIDLAEKKKRFPSAKARFCTEELKVKPAIDYVLSHSEHLIIIEGIRKNESFSRSKMLPACHYFRHYFEAAPNGKTHTYRKKEIIEWCKNWNADKHRPIFNWTAQETIDYIRDNGQQPNLLYFQGFTRVGCFPCIMSKHSEIKRIIEAHQDQWEFLKNAEKRLNTSFFPPDKIPKRFCTNKHYPTGQDVENYLTRYDGIFPMFEKDTPGCMSAYNLCE